MAIRLGDTAPDFTAQTTEGELKFHEWLGDSWGVLFSHPKDYTPVCTTELGAVARLKPEFDKRNVKVAGLSVDPLEDHKGWAGDIEETQGVALNYPLIADPDRKVLYGWRIGYVFDIGQTDGRPIPVFGERLGPAPGQSDHIANASVGYERGGFSGRVSVTYQSSYLESVTRTELRDAYTDDFTRWDISVRQRVGGSFAIDALDDAGGGGVVGAGAHELDDLAAAALRPLDDGLDGLVVHQFGQRDAADGRVARQRHHGVAVAAHQHCLDVFGRHVQCLGKESPVAGSVKDTGHAHYFVPGFFGNQVRLVCHDIQWVRHHDDDGLR